MEELRFLPDPLSGASVSEYLTDSAGIIRVPTMVIPGSAGKKHIEEWKNDHWQDGDVLLLSYLKNGRLILYYKLVAFYIAQFSILFYLYLIFCSILYFNCFFSQMISNHLTKADFNFCLYTAVNGLNSAEIS